MDQFNGVKIFSATLARNREGLGDKVTEWLTENSRCKLIDLKVVQSSDREFHCISIILFYQEQL